MVERQEALGRGDTAAANTIKARLWSCVKEEYGDPKTTPLEVEITASTKTLTVDAGPAVQIELPLVL